MRRVILTPLMRCRFTTKKILLISLLTLIICILAYQYIHVMIEAGRKTFRRPQRRKVMVTQSLTGREKEKHMARLKFLDKNMDVSSTYDLRQGNISLYIPKYLAPPSDVCQRSKVNITAVIMIFSKPGNFAQRMGIRHTWGSFTQQRDVKIVYVLGLNRDDEIHQKVNEEVQLYGDIIQGDFPDGLRTIKMMFALNHIQDFCGNAKFVVKTLDDVFINMPQLLAFLGDDSAQKYAIWGYRSSLSTMFVRNKCQLYLGTGSQQQCSNLLSDHLYIMSMEAAIDLFKMAQASIHIPNESIMFTAVLPSKLKLTKIQFRSSSWTKPNVKTEIAIAKQSVQDMFTQWKIISAELYSLKD